ncbi:MAG: DegV family protein [Clostridia bacterium]|nr:DegV family protein [Clostridia bacterium]
MVNKYRIISDGSCDFSPEQAKEMNVGLVPFYVSFDGETYKKEHIEQSVDDFYNAMLDDASVFPKSSTPTVNDYYEAFEEAVKAGEGVICICITQKFSASIQSATIARGMILDDYPDAQIALIDSTVNTVLQGLFVLQAVALRDGGVDFKRAVETLELIKGTGRIFFTLASMDYLRKGGRIGKLKGIAASLLRIQPIITLMRGEIHNSGITRSRHQAKDKTIALLLNHVRENGLDLNDYALAVGYGSDYEEAVRFREALVAALNGAITVEDIPIRRIGATIAVHTGPRPLGVGIIKKPVI